MIKNIVALYNYYITFIVVVAIFYLHAIAGGFNSLPLSLSLVVDKVSLSTQCKA